MSEFEGIVDTLCQALNKRGYNQLTPVQKAVLAPEVQQSDALVSAQTGSGKTVAFGLTIATTLLDDTDHFGHAKAPVALVVAPTRELALQVKRELEWLYEIAGAIVVSCVGGMDMRTERRDLSRNAHVVVGTPGRLRDHIERGSFDTKELKAVVLDEADEMLDLGFRDDLEYILDATPKDRRTLMFSATVPRSIANLAKRYQRNAVRVTTTAEREQHLDIEYRALTVAPNDRENAIVNVLRYFEAKNALVFCSTRATVNHMTSRFNNRGFSVVALSGELSQNERTHALQSMRNGRARVCIATDVAARGIDLPNLELVIHADMPKNRESLLHRSGRTGRAGRKGVCALIVPHNSRKRTERLLSSANVEATWAKPPSADEIMQRDRQRILEDPVLSDPMNEFEQTFVNEILERHSAEQIVAAFVRQNFAERTAPEELIDTVPAERPRKQRNGFIGGVWFSLSVGREQTAEARWLLPMLCRAGHITKDEIGAIRIHQTETHVELTPESVEGFLKAIGPSGKVEKNVAITRMDGAPQALRDEHKPRGRKTFKGKKEFSNKGKKEFPEERPVFAWAKKPKDKKKAKKKDNKKLGQNKKPYQSQFAASGGNDASPAEPGSSPLKRKKKHRKTPH
jgi:ATP-dependent RNA helicase DeaD